MTNGLSNREFPDSINIENITFEKQKKEKSPFEANLCCLENTKCNRFFFILNLHCSILLMLVLFSIRFVTFNSKTNYHSVVLALFSACIGCIFPGSKAWAKKIIANLTALFRSLSRSDVVNLNWSHEYSSTQPKIIFKPCFEKRVLFQTFSNWLRIASFGTHMGKNFTQISSRTSTDKSW